MRTRFKPVTNKSTCSHMRRIWRFLVGPANFVLRPVAASGDAMRHDAASEVGEARPDTEEENGGRDWGTQASPRAGPSPGSFFVVNLLRCSDPGRF